jgi:hypothetical protein
MSSRSKRAAAAFHSVKDAKDFLAGRIIDQADREGAPLTDVERKMLYFSESHSSLPGMSDIYDEFDRDYDQTVYEKKMAAIARRAYRHDWHDDSEDAYRWLGAIRRLKSEDHYLSVILHQAVIRPPYDSMKLWLSALGLVLVMLAGLGAIEFFGDHIPADITRYLPSAGAIKWVVVVLFVAFALWSNFANRSAPRRPLRTKKDDDAPPPVQESTDASYLFMHDKESRDKRVSMIAVVVWCLVAAAALNSSSFRGISPRNLLFYFLWSLIVMAAVISLFTDRHKR